MINYTKFTLSNGLRVIVHEDASTPMAAINILYDVGARDEDASRTGFAHLFEHLMFEGSQHIPSYDTPLQLAGGSNNAFTNNDITNYYITVPAANIEIGFWLESDRMLELGFSEEKLAIQKKVVIEEFKQRYLNQPYGDLWLMMRPLAYKNHPYQWPTIGKEIRHIEEATLQDVRDFFFRHYAPNNAIMVIAGNVKTDDMRALSEKWFGNIPRRDVPVRNLPQETPQEETRRLTVERDVPSDAVMMAFHMPGRTSDDYYRADLLSDILSTGKSSRLHEQLVKKEAIFTELGAYVMGSIDPGLLVIFGKLHQGHSIADGEKAIWKCLDALKKDGIEERELDKVKNKLETTERFGLTSVLNIAMKLAFFELLGDAGLINSEMQKYREVDAAAIGDLAARLLKEENCVVLEYKGMPALKEITPA